MTTSSKTERIAELIDARCRKSNWEWHARLDTATDCSWQCQLTVDLTPSRSVVTRATGGDEPDEVLSAAWDDMRDWLGDLPGGDR